MPVKPDPNILYPLVCFINTPYGNIDLSDRLPKRGGVTLEDVPAEEMQDFRDRNSISIEPGECLPPETSSTDTTEITTVAGQVTTTRTQKTVNPDGTVTTTTTTTKPDGTQTVQIDTEPFTPPRPAGVLIRIDLANGAEFSLIRPATKLRVGDACTVIENFSDRHALRAWVNAVVHAPPKTTFLSNANFSEFYTLQLEFLILGGAP